LAAGQLEGQGGVQRGVPNGGRLVRRNGKRHAPKRPIRALQSSQSEVGKVADF
jgi:hypothetical protein